MNKDQLAMHASVTIIKAVLEESAKELERIGIALETINIETWSTFFHEKLLSSGVQDDLDEALEAFGDEGNKDAVQRFADRTTEIGIQIARDFIKKEYAN